MQEVVFPKWPFFDEEQLRAAGDVLTSGRVNYWTGDEGRSFEAEYAEYVGVRHAIALSNGTVALELALRAIGVVPGDEVIVPARTFIATASAVVAVGATPVVADIDADSGGLTAETIAACITPRTSAVVVVHLGGWPCDMDSITALTRARGLRLVEDCAQAHGATWAGRPVGSFGDAAAFSFCNDKIITTAGEGGMLLTDDEAIWKRAWEYKDHGKDFESTRASGAGGTGSFRWVHRSFGSNYRLTEVQSAIGRIQLKRLDEWTARRGENAATLHQGLLGTPGLRLVTPPPMARHAWYRYYVYVEPDSLMEGWTRDRIVNEVVESGVPCQVGSCSEIYREQAFIDAGFAPTAPLPNAARSQRTSIALLVHPTLEKRHMMRATDVLHEVMTRAAEPSACL